MKCENLFCIYEKDGDCILDNIELDISGSCQNCIYVDIPENLLETLKTSCLENLENRYDA